MKVSVYCVFGILGTLSYLRASEKTMPASAFDVIFSQNITMEEKIDSYKKQVLSTSEFLDACKDQLKEYFGLNEDLELQLVNQLPVIMVTAGNWKVKIEDLSKTNLQSLMTLTLRLTDEENLVLHRKFSFHCALWKEVYFSSHRLSVNSSLNSTQVVCRNVNILDYKKPLVASDLDLGRYELCASVNAGIPLTMDNLRLKPDVRKGKLLEVVAKEGMLEVTTQGVAQENGFCGELIKVRNVRSQKELLVQVINENTVAVRF